MQLPRTIIGHLEVPCLRPGRTSRAQPHRHDLSSTSCYISFNITEPSTRDHLIYRTQTEKPVASRVSDGDSAKSASKSTGRTFRNTCWRIRVILPHALQKRWSAKSDGNISFHFDHECRLWFEVGYSDPGVSSHAVQRLLTWLIPGCNPLSRIMRIAWKRPPLSANRDSPLERTPADGSVMTSKGPFERISVFGPSKC